MKVLLSGYYGFGNAGDELLLRSIVQELLAGEKDTKITILSSSPGKTAKETGVEAVGRWNPFSVIKSLCSCDRFISGGGGLFQDRTGSLSLYYYLSLIVLAKLLGKKVFLYSVGVNELRKINRKATAAVLSLADAITVRDAGSKSLLSDWGVLSSKIEITADPVLLIGRRRQRSSSERPTVTMILRPVGDNNDGVSLFADIAGEIAERLNAKVQLISFHPIFDKSFVQAVARKAPQTLQVIEWQDPSEVLDAIGSADLVVSQRLHGLILSLVSGIPFVGISDDPKLIRFMSEMGLQCRSSREDGRSLLSEVLSTWEKREEFSAKMDRILPALRERAGSAARLFYGKSKTE